MADADFYLQRTGDEKTVGTPKREGTADDLGIKVVRTDILLPDYLFYVMQYLHMQGVLKEIAVGSATKTITAKSVGEIPVGQQ
jgi:hypothetical protein